jgi:polyhydroxyalkanoate synthesis regulator phasin
VLNYKEVAKLVKEHSDKMVKEVGVEPNLTVEDAKEYLDEVIEELNKHRSSK